MATRQDILDVGISQPLLSLQGGCRGRTHPIPSSLLTTHLLPGSALAEPHGKPEARDTQVSPEGHRAGWRRWRVDMQGQQEDWPAPDSRTPNLETHWMKLLSLAHQGSVHKKMREGEEKLKTGGN